MDTAEVFDYGDKNATNMVSLIEKNKEFKITFGLYEPYGAWHHSSGFRFECFSSTFIPSGYPTQLCGDFFFFTLCVCACVRARARARACVRVSVCL